jgi:hypothetical protein
LINDAGDEANAPAGPAQPFGPSPEDIRAAMARVRSQIWVAVDLAFRGQAQLYCALGDISYITQRIIHDPADCAAFWSDPYFATHRCSNDPYLAATLFSLQATTDAQRKTASLWARAIKYQVIVCRRAPDQLPEAFRAMRGGITEAARLYRNFERSRAAKASASRPNSTMRSGPRNSEYDGTSVHLMLEISSADRLALEAAGQQVRVTEWSLLTAIGAGKARIIRIQPREE